ncbi:hypothetical protein CTAYLR_003376 [Chrysophaeum taylorii]|uniref:Exoribonuclease phosphorolytic domain-containing protein n=1 Tax=Chrysophaeum taylorii TaxID=2483200 RepID=A0AAD7UEL6_9STRA|nr:hypothetical protein CTAYLR_003376 [Chrysophaeum taylorii]
MDADARAGLALETGCFEHVNGSCRWFEGGTYVIATIAGPRHVSEKGYSHNPERGALQVRCQLSQRGAPDRVVKERRLEEHVNAVLSRVVALESFARQIVTVALLVVLDDGSSLRVALNAAVSALRDASVPLLTVPLSVTPCVGTNVQADVVFDGERRFLAFETRGTISMDDLEACFAAAEHDRANLAQSLDK